MGLYDKNPCKGCVPPKRQPGCHGWCGERKEWREQFDTDKEKIRKEQEQDVEISKIIAASKSCNKNGRRRKNK